MLLAFDDTDSVDGGCTTSLIFEVLASLEGLAPRGMPRLVRLNPNIPHKTRGNAAVVVELGTLEGPATQIGEWRGHQVLARPDGGEPPDPARVLDACWEVLERRAEEGADPGVAVAMEPLPAGLYWQAVRALAEQEACRQAAKDAGALLRGGQGIVGATAALAWPGPASSYELLAYRSPPSLGTPRQVDGPAFRVLDATGATFHSWDDEEARPTCVPSTPCPVLLGLRGRDPDRLLRGAMGVLPTAVAEPMDAWMLWATNQASGDHVTPVDALEETPPWGTARVRLTVTAPAETRPGGHATCQAEDAAGRTVALVAFEPTHSLPAAVRSLAPGDMVEATGALADGSLRLERLDVVTLAALHEKVENPVCSCGDRMKSAGADAGYRCPSCGQRASDAPVHAVDRQVKVGTYEPAVMARRHLHRPADWDPHLR